MSPSWRPRWTGAARRDAVPSRPGPGSGARVRVLSRTGCHLCDDALAVVQQVCDARGESYDVQDVDTDPVLLARYGTQVPVVFVDDAEFATWRVDAGKLDAALRRACRPTDGSHGR